MYAQMCKLLSDPGATKAVNGTLELFLDVVDNSHIVGALICLGLQSLAKRWVSDAGVREDLGV